ncbi:GDSL esterase/lipase At1g29670-like [Bidens hawaiensis]|uniref:GDSL esterase/lipase At1g29670-like n=1 Tax=Bidens hawaiensis TaxID=980011 RepID=UPI00404A28B4
MIRELRHVLLFVGLIQITTLIVAASEPQVPCYFVFGDSFVDAGNCNANRFYRANYPPYGIDFPDGATGRYTNARTFADIIGELVGFPKFIPPFVNRTTEDIKTGVNYACGMDGIYPHWGNLLLGRTSLGTQVGEHERDITRLPDLQINNTTRTYEQEYLKKCIYLVNIGTYDLMYHVFGFRTSVAVDSYGRDLERLYSMGARKVAVFGLSKIGCSPEFRNRNNGNCIERTNEQVSDFNDELKNKVGTLNSRYSDARFTFISVANISQSQEDAPVPAYPCCEINRQGMCVPNSSPCVDRSSSFFYDGLHPTEIINKIIATRAYNADDEMYAYPYNISRLAQD